jgi:hypothetical protein
MKNHTINAGLFAKLCGERNINQFLSINAWIHPLQAFRNQQKMPITNEWLPPVIYSYYPTKI